jgi:hypothetical protein
MSDELAHALKLADVVLEKAFDPDADICVLARQLIRRDGRVDTLQKALDDRHAADKKAWSAIMRATGKERGIPPNKEVVAFYVAEVERLEGELSEMSALADARCTEKEFVEDENADLRAKLKRAAPIIAAYVVQNPKWTHHERGEQDPMGAHALLSELSADSPTRQTQTSDDVRDAMVEAKKALELYAYPEKAKDRLGGPVCVPDFYSELDFGDVARAALAKLRSIMK